jgi:beta-lactamase regulating signal transducer with metallopeptidase domain
MPLMTWVASNVVLALVLALAAWAAQRWLARTAVAHALWVLVLVKLVTPPLVTVPLGQSPGPVACALGVCGCDHHSPAQDFVRDTLPWALLAAWSAGAGAKAWVAWRRWAWFRRLLAHARPAPPDWQALAARLASEMGLRRPPEVLAVPGRLPPLVLPGRPRPRVLLPTALLGRLDAPQRAALLMHELAHIRRGDHLVRMLEFTVGVAYWWLPVVGPVGRRLRACEETCCDAAVVAQLPAARRDYARLLLDVIEFAAPPRGQAAPPATAMSAAADLEQRLRAILHAAPGARRTRLAGALTVALACAILPCRLQYGSAGRPAPAAPTAAQESAAEAAGAPGGDPVGKPFKDVCCCPS